MTVNPGNERYVPVAFDFGTGHVERITSHEDIDLNITPKSKKNPDFFLDFRIRWAGVL